MADVDFAPGFALATGRDVTIEVVTALHDCRVRLDTPDGRPLFDGRATAADAWPIRVHLPPGVDAVHAVATREGVPVVAVAAPVRDDQTVRVVLEAP